MKLPKKESDFPKNTPLFGVCSQCKGVLPYPPVQVPIWIKPGETFSKWRIKWNRYCFDCAPGAIKEQRKQVNDLIPDKAWDPAYEDPVKNPYKGDSKS